MNSLRIIKRNYKAKIGEIDIIAIDKKEVVFIEVKTRVNNKYGYPIEAVDYKKQQKIKNVCKCFINQYKIKNFRIRFDVIEVYIKGRNIKVHHVKNVFF